MWRFYLSLECVASAHIVNLTDWPEDRQKRVISQTVILINLHYMINLKCDNDPVKNYHFKGLEAVMFWVMYNAGLWQQEAEE